MYEQEVTVKMKHVNSYTAQLAKQAKRSSRLIRLITTVQKSRFGPFPRHGLPPFLPPSFSLPFYLPTGTVRLLALFQVYENGV
jgi:hypothetical protein